MKQVLRVVACCAGLLGLLALTGCGYVLAAGAGAGAGYAAGRSQDSHD
ncbi:MAG: hypothetical protein U0637_03785 [Phycisphaerales bacterium]